MRCITEYGCQLEVGYENKDRIGKISVAFSR